MTDAEFRTLVAAVRAAQKAYFKTRFRDDLYKAKTLEAKLDKALDELPHSPNDEVAR